MAVPSRGRSTAALAIAGMAVAMLPVLSTAAPAAPENPWTKVSAPSIAAKSARQTDVHTTRYAGYTLDKPVMQAKLAPAGNEVLLPTPEGKFQRFTLTDAPVMEPGLAAAHPEIRTYSGKGVEDPTATVRADLTPLGFHASVRSQRGQWYVDPYYHADQSLYASYYGHDLSEVGPLQEKDIAGLTKELHAAPAGPEVKLRTYRLALVTDPSYATYFGAANVTAAKVTLINRVTQIYEDELAIRLVLINDTDKTNLNTPAQATLANGPCGAAPCYKPEELRFCDIPTLFATGVALGQIVGADKYDIGHLGLGVNGGGIAGLGVVGGDQKAVGCTGLPTPVGDFYAVDYVAHEMGHQFGGDHPFNGTQTNCSLDNRNGPTSVEPGSGSSIMAYAGICQQDNLQPHSDPYFSERSFDEITTYVTSDQPNINEQQDVALRDFDGTDSFTVSYNGRLSAPVVRGVNYTPAGVKAAIEGIVGWPAGATATVAGFGNNTDNRPMPFDDTGFQVTFGGTLAGKDVASLGLSVRGGSGNVGESIKGGPVENHGNKIDNTGNHVPVVTTPSAHTIPVRTPFSLTGSATDADSDALTYMWEQNDEGGVTGTGLVDNTKKNGPLFRQFGTAAVVTAADALKYYSPGENAVNTNPTRDFPDLAQIAANNTNAKTGACPAAPPPPTSGGATNVPADVIDCYSEFLPTSDWVGLDNSRTLHFRLTARDGRLNGGGVGHADTTLTLAPSAGPFLVTSQGTPSVYAGGSTQTVTWDVAGTNAAPVNAANVKISLSTDGGLTFPHVLAASTANNGSATVALPNVPTTKGRIKIEAVGNVFFDLNDADITIHAAPVVTVAPTASVQYSDALTVPVTAKDADSTVLSATATGLPAGLSLTGSNGTWTISGTTTASPGDYSVSIAVTDDTGVAGKASLTIKVKPEDAVATYTGDSLVYGSSVRFRATVRDITDASPGDVRTGNVSFLADGKTLCTAPLGLLGTAPTDASGSCTAKLPLGVKDVTVSVGGNYTGTVSTRVETARDQFKAVVGSGFLTESHSAGTYAADEGSRAAVSFAVGHIWSTTSGFASLTFRSGGSWYQIRDTRFDSFGAKGSTLDIRGRATIVDMAGNTVASGTLQLTAQGNAVAITLLDGDKLLFSSDWTGAITQQDRLAPGSILII
ncbi:M12 family metallo-peptidase [Actinocrispum wychmicini]|uniref:Reprolysin-like metallo-peptidase family M12B n=1 Tax=Actinocrispum wychmicini TaxID=1213861 RepID=A0A4R2JGE8_9PSEU|nr:M12 family metallo-peptidase [Actinocrispum wychmicini]TCO57362.1 reprolysin-like metallo-peptidase family M12B [Actinocrispum wychmicini]